MRFRRCILLVGETIRRVARPAARRHRLPEHTVCAPKPSTVVWDNLDEFIRQQIQGVLMGLLDEEVNASLGRLKSQRRAPEAAAGSAPAAYRNGSGQPRQVATPSGTVTVRRP